MQQDRLAAAVTGEEGNATLYQEDGNEMENGNEKTAFTAKLWHFVRRNAAAVAGSAVLMIVLAGAIWLLSFFSVVVYCYDGAESYRRMGILFLRKEHGEYELYLPEEMAENAKSSRFRLVLKERLVKKCGRKNLTIHGKDRKISQSMEECMDFVL